MAEQMFFSHQKTTSSTSVSVAVRVKTARKRSINSHTTHKLLRESVRDFIAQRLTTIYAHGYVLDACE